VRELPQHIQASIATTVTFFHNALASTATVALFSDTNNEIFSATNATISTVNTTLNGAVSAGATSIIVTSQTGIAAGDRLYIADPSEEVLVKTTPTSTTVALKRPLLNDHADGEAVVLSKLTYSVTAAQAATKFWDGRLKWVIDTSTIRYQDAIVTEYAFYRSASEQTLFDEEPKLYELIDTEHDVDRLLDDGLAEVIIRINAMTQGRAWTYTGPTQFTAANVFASLMMLYRRRGGDVSEQLYERYKTALKDELTLITAAAPRDTDQDGVIEAGEQASRGSGLIRRG